MTSQSCESIHNYEIPNYCLSSRKWFVWVWSSIVLSSCISITCTILSVRFLDIQDPPTWSIYLLLAASGWLYFTTIFNSALLIDAQIALRRIVRQHQLAVHFHRSRTRGRSCDNSSSQRQIEVYDASPSNLRKSEAHRILGITPPPAYFDDPDDNDYSNVCQRSINDSEASWRFIRTSQKQLDLDAPKVQCSSKSDLDQVSSSSDVIDHRLKKFHPYPASAALRASDSKLCYEELQRASKRAGTGHEGHETVPQKCISTLIRDHQLPGNRDSVPTSDQEFHSRSSLGHSEQTKPKTTYSRRDTSYEAQVKCKPKTISHDDELETTSSITCSNKESFSKEREPGQKLNKNANSGHFDPSRPGPSTESLLQWGTMSKQEAVQRWMIAHSQILMQRAPSDASKSEQVTQPPDGILGESSKKLYRQFTSCQNLTPRSPAKRLQSRLQKNQPHPNLKKSSDSEGDTQSSNDIQQEQSTTSLNKGAIVKDSRVRRSFSQHNLSSEEWFHKWNTTIDKMATREDSRMLGVRL